MIIVNASMARGVFEGSEVLGEHIRLGVGLGPDYDDPPRVIVGVAGDVRESGLDQPAGWTVFIPRTQVPTALTAPINRLAGTSWAVRASVPRRNLLTPCDVPSWPLTPSNPFQTCAPWRK